MEIKNFFVYLLIFALFFLVGHVVSSIPGCVSEKVEVNGVEKEKVGNDGLSVGQLRSVGRAGEVFS